ncbi:hypothetical protein KUV44_09485 [Marinobacter daepoensis]|uniref:Acyl dehydratase n=1 Tax=Marinobacter daepoensis TaxID=262077 RepID=A0ABS3B9T5_9GAMM|nr:hypothetical protein [Marinobacter daepoensis]MBN7768633.1 hypothetical protein [Marinobacter daepoensis]MBY6079370.1 hypothetical protein [Marinobacter daepoensis]
MTETTLPRFEQLREQQLVSVHRQFSPEDLEQWSRMAGLEQPIERVPEPLIAGLFSYLLGMELPGKGTNYLKQSMTFAAQARVNEPLTATVRISRLRPDKALVNLETICSGDNDRVICRGEALVLFQC